MAGHRWARLDVQYFSNPKILELSAHAKLLHIASILYCAEHLTDGRIARVALKACADRAGIRRDSRTRRCTELVAAGLWDELEDGWFLHDFEDMNPQAMRDVVEQERSANRERQARWKANHNAVSKFQVTDTTRHDTTQVLPITHMTPKVMRPLAAVDNSRTEEGQTA